MGMLALGRPKVIPCTPLGCYKMLESILDLQGKNVIILGRSNIVGKPLSFLLTNKNATVTLAHSKSKNLKDDYLDRFNYETYGGTPILGINSTVIVGHGISNSEAIKNMILLAHDVEKARLTEKIKAVLQHE